MRVRPTNRAEMEKLYYIQDIAPGDVVKLKVKAGLRFPMIGEEVIVSRVRSYDERLRIRGDFSEDACFIAIDEDGDHKEFGIDTRFFERV